MSQEALKKIQSEISKTCLDELKVLAIRNNCTLPMVIKNILETHVTRIISKQDKVG